MPIIKVRDNENNRWNRNWKKKQKKTKQTEKNKGVTQAIVKGWELIDFVVPVN